MLPLLLPLLENLRQGSFYQIGWDGEADAVGGRVGLRVNGGQGWDADELPLQIDEGPAAITGIDGRIRLDGLGDCGTV